MDSSLAGKVVLVTGASSGLGEAFARFLAERGLRVILTARRAQRLADIVNEIRNQGGTAEFFPGDIRNPQVRAKLARDVQVKAGHVDILINNAGFGWYGYFHTMDWSDAARMIAVNIEAAAHLTHLFLPDMLARRTGHIINISSIAGGLPNQGIAMYSGSKAFLDAFSTALHRELRGSGVTASAMRLGPVETEFFEQARKMKNGGNVPAEKMAIPVGRVNQALWRLLRHPRRVMYVPGWLAVTRLVEPLLGGLIDPLGPLLLRRG